MESKSFRSRFFFVALPVLLIITFVTSASAQGLFGEGLPGLPSFGDSLRGTGSCGETPCPPTGPLVFYVGWMEDRNGTCFDASADGTGVLGISHLSHCYPNRGVWLGLGGSARLSDNVSFLAAGWYLIPSNADSREHYNDGIIGPFPVSAQTWHTDTQWWWAEGILGFGPQCGPASLLLGLRYDVFTTRFKDPPFDRIAGVPDLIDDQGDVFSRAIIPLIGVQSSYDSSNSRLLARIIGFPSLFGWVKYNETVLVTSRVEGSGNYNGRGFLEVFAEYSRKWAGAEIGVFGRWNMLRGNGNLNLDVQGGFDGLGAAGQKYALSITRTSWTLGGSFSLAFDLPL
jgi:hypothetical protein